MGELAMWLVGTFHQHRWVGVDFEEPVLGLEPLTGVIVSKDWDRLRCGSGVSQFGVPRSALQLIMPSGFCLVYQR